MPQMMENICQPGGGGLRVATVLTNAMATAKYQIAPKQCSTRTIESESCLGRTKRKTQIGNVAMTTAIQAGRMFLNNSDIRAA